MNARQHHGFTLVEWLVTIAIVAILLTFMIPGGTYTSESSKQNRQTSNIFQIAISCVVYSNDHNGRFPDGTLEQKDAVATTAEACFNDLIRSQTLNVEKIFWSPNHLTHCRQFPPNENGTLEPGENCWDYIADLNQSSPNTSDNGSGTTWTKSKGHPWKGLVFAAYVDGSSEKLPLDSNGRGHPLQVGFALILGVCGIDLRRADGQHAGADIPASVSFFMRQRAGNRVRDKIVKLGRKAPFFLRLKVSRS